MCLCFGKSSNDQNHEPYGGATWRLPVITHNINPLGFFKKK